jgi:arylsulfatase A-like enzyme
MRIHWQGPGSAGYQDMNEGVSIWDERSNYRREIVRADSTVGHFVAWLKDNDLWKATRLFVMGDHGQNDEGWHAPYVGQAQRQPVIICGNGIKEGKEYSYAEAVDICTTIAHLHGVPKPKFSQGRVLTEAIQGQPDTAPETGPVQRLNALLLAHHALLEQIDEEQIKKIRDLNRQFHTIETMGTWHRHFKSVEALISHQEDVLTAMKNMIGT